MTKDYFIQKFREDPALRSSFAARLDEMCDQLMHELVSLNEMDKIRMAQGAIRGLRRFQTVVEKEIAAPLANDENKR